jgi:CheY-like chemotaxis protein
MADNPPNPQRKCRVLVVDDHLDTAHSLALLLRHMGHEVEYAINGYSALQVADTFRPEVVFVDMFLPDFHGSDLSRQLRVNLLPQSIRIVAVTGQPDDHVRQRAELAGCNDFLLKPLDIEKVERALDAATG